MLKKRMVTIILIQLVLLLVVSNSLASASSSPKSIQAPPLSANDVISAINSYRIQNGLPALTTNSLLTTLAQNQSNYQASIDYVTHTGADGSTPQQRATAAGYGNGAGFYLSEIIYGGYNQSVEKALAWWKNSSLHNGIMLSAKYNEIGAGVATNGDNVYFTAVLGGVYGNPVPTSVSTNTGGEPGPTQNPTAEIPVSIPVQKSTPNADGSIIHIVQTGQTLWTIAAVYGVELDTLLEFNDLDNYSFVFPGDEILIRPPGFTQTPSPSLRSDTTQNAEAAPDKILGTPVSFSAKPQITNTPITILIPVAEEDAEETQPKETGNPFLENSTARTIVIIAFACLFIAVVGSIFLQKPPTKQEDKD
jgi:uncharacterized protein YkwD